MTYTPIISGGGTQVPSTSSTQYNPCNGVLAPWTTTENNDRNVCPAAGSISNLYIHTDTNPTPGNYTFTLFKNGVTTALTCNLAAGNTTTHDILHTVTVAAGDTISIECAPAASPASLVRVRVGYLFTSSVAGESIILGTSRAITANTTRFCTLQGDSSPTGTEVNATSCMPTAGSITEIWMEVNTAAGLTDTITCTLVKNGSATSQTTNVTGSSQTTNHTTANSTSFVAGDTVSMQITASVTANASIVRWGCKWVPTIDGEALLLQGRLGLAGNSQTVYQLLSGTTPVNATESNNQQVSPAAFTAKKLFVKLGTTTGATTLTSSVSKNASITGMPTVPITGATTGNDSSTNGSIAAGDVLSLQEVTNGNYSGSWGAYGLVAYIPPSSGGNNMMMMGMS